MGDYSTIVLDKYDGLAKITLNRPLAMNAISRLLRDEFRKAIGEVESDEEVGVLILTGAGKSFCAGIDLKELEEGFEELLIPSPGDYLRLLDKPTIAAVNGYAITGGMELALCSDIIIASEAAVFGDTHARIGVVPGSGMTQILPRLVGSKKAKELSLTGNFIRAEEAWRLGLVNRVVPAEELMSVAESLARDILSSDRTVVRAIKRLIDRGEGLPIDMAIVLEQHEHLLHHQKGGQPANLRQRREDVFARGRGQVASHADPSPQGRAE